MLLSRPLPGETGGGSLFDTEPRPPNRRVSPQILSPSCALSSPLPLAAWQSRRSPQNRVSGDLFALISESILRFTHPSPLRSRFQPLRGSNRCRSEEVRPSLGAYLGFCFCFFFFSASCDECCRVWKVGGILGLEIVKAKCDVDVYSF